MSRLSTGLLNWYRDNKRTPPWRDHPDPYAVWVSEVMLQQTRVETVVPYFDTWMRLFPDVHALAEASEREVLNVWEGLGYYSRARNLHKAAKIVETEYDGELPRDPIALRKLPGIGRYTAGAIASIAFGLDEPALDGNIKRVYARLFDVSEPVDSPMGEKMLWEIARKHLPKGRAGDFNQALMDLGAMICVPRKPRCPVCPVTKICRARANGTQEQRPVRRTRRDAPHRIHAAGVIMGRGKVLLAQRPSRGLLGGMWEFPNGRVDGDPARGLAKALKTGYRLNVEKKEALWIVQHTYSHFRVSVHVFRCQISRGNIGEGLKWVAVRDLEEYPMGKVDRQIAQMLRSRASNLLECRWNMA